MGLVTDYSWAVKQYWSSCMCVHALHCMPSCSVSTHPFSVGSVWQQCPRIQKVITRGINLHRFQTHKHSGIITVFFWIVSNFNIFISEYVKQSFCFNCLNLPRNLDHIQSKPNFLHDIPDDDHLPSDKLCLQKHKNVSCFENIIWTKPIHMKKWRNKH